MTASSPPTPAVASAAPASTPSAPSTQRRRRCLPSRGSGRLRIAVTMFMRLTRQAENATTISVSSTPMAYPSRNVVGFTEYVIWTSSALANAPTIASTIP